MFHVSSDNLTEDSTKNMSRGMYSIHCSHRADIINKWFMYRLIYRNDKEKKPKQLIHNN